MRIKPLHVVAVAPIVVVTLLVLMTAMNYKKRRVSDCAPGLMTWTAGAKFAYGDFQKACDAWRGGPDEARMILESTEVHMQFVAMSTLESPVPRAHVDVRGPARRRQVHGVVRPAPPDGDVRHGRRHPASPHGRAQ